MSVSASQQAKQLLAGTGATAQSSQWNSLGPVLKTALAVGTAGGLLYGLQAFRRKGALGPSLSSRKWFAEKSSLWPGQAFVLEVKQTLLDTKSEFQRIQVFDTATYGKVLVLDGVIQCTERDEFSYQEMMTHTAVMAHPNPRKVLVIGGGDGGVLRELSKHSSIEKIDLCEIDSGVVSASKRFLPHMSVGFEDPRVKVYFTDGFAFAKENRAAYDVIIVDSSDPVGPANTLFELPFYQAVYDALTPNGVAVCQGESMWLDLTFVTELVAGCAKIFPAVDYGVVAVPTYPCGSIGLLCLAKNKNNRVRNPVRKMSPELTQKLRYYSPEIHKAAFVLPHFAHQALTQYTE